MNLLMMELWTRSWQTAVVALIVIAVRAVMGHRLSPVWRCGLWGIVLLRLLMPALPHSAFSVFAINPHFNHRMPGSRACYELSTIPISRVSITHANAAKCIPASVDARRS